MPTTDSVMRAWDQYTNYLSRNKALPIQNYEWLKGWFRGHIQRWQQILATRKSVDVAGATLADIVGSKSASNQSYFIMYNRMDNIVLLGLLSPE